MKENSIKKSKGFTLIELLAVIVILAIIALIVTPIILNIISESRDKSNQRSVEGLEHAIETTVGLIMLDDNYSGGDIICKNEKYMSESEKTDTSATEKETYCWDVNKRKETSKQVTYSGNRVVASTIQVSMETGDIEVGNAQVGSSSKRYTTADSDTLYGTILKELLEAGNDDNIFVDDYGNIRYRGANPNNYVTFNDETWRIIGIIDGKVKLIRDKSIGNLSWDISDSSINSGNGINEWSQAYLMKLLNPGYENEILTNGEAKTSGSLYWNNASGNCYGSNTNNSHSKSIIECNFDGQNGHQKGLSEEAKSMIEKSTWYLGAYDYTNIVDKVTLSDIYKLMDAERGTEVYKEDNITRTTIWNGYVGLLYPSDYTQATNSTNCNGAVGQWNSTDNSDCRTNDWLYKKDYFQWTMSSRSDNAYLVWDVGYSGRVVDWDAYHAGGVHPVVNLKSSIKVKSGDGKSGSAYQLAD